VRVRGNSVVPQNLFGRFAVLCAILRQLHLILQIAVFSDELAQLAPSVFFVDQVSAGVPLLRLLRPAARVLFYCHFPDQLLAKRDGVLKALYRLPFDWLESWSTGCSDGILVNSRFTKGVFAETFPALKGRDPAVVYPSVDTMTPDVDDGDILWKGERVLLRTLGWPYGPMQGFPTACAKDPSWSSQVCRQHTLSCVSNLNRGL
jgi:alpha-1,3/alpha-1,6-mannosyltransferase